MMSADMGSSIKEIETATFSMGCFWHPQYIFSQFRGVLRARVGYAGGTTKKSHL